jgi:hypothetical protein
MRTIQVSADVYAAIWKRQEPGEGAEEEILRRVLGVTASPIPLHGAAMPEADIGVYDRRNNVKFPSGFEVFRNYKGNEYRARARGGLWYRDDTGDAFPTLNQLSNSIGASEDAWQGWLHRDEDGHVSKVYSLRAGSKAQL